MKICCMVSSLSAGGAERVMSLLANEWAARGRDVTVVTLASAASDLYSLDPRVSRVALDLEVESRSIAQGIKHNLRKMLALRQTVTFLKPDVVISFVNRLNVIAILSCLGLRVPVIVSERTHAPSEPVNKAWGLLRRLTYPLADAVVVQSKATLAWAEPLVRSGRAYVIPNPVGRQFPVGRDWSGQERRRIVLGVGRLSPEKGFDLLIKAFRLALQRHPEWSLVILGQGPSEGELKALAASLLPKGAVLFAGVVNDPQRFYRDAALFVLPSRYEGFPNALLEAMASGCAVIATNSPGGTSEIVRHGVDGVLIPPESVEALVSAMHNLMTDESQRRCLAAQGTERASRFAVDKVIVVWEDVISEVRR